MLGMVCTSYSTSAMNHPTYVGLQPVHYYPNHDGLFATEGTSLLVKRKPIHLDC
jgi:hypothetical protein